MIQSPKILIFQEYFSPGYLAGGMQTASFHFLSGGNVFNIRMVTSNVDLNKVTPYKDIFGKNLSPNFLFVHLSGKISL